MRKLLIPALLALTLAACETEPVSTASTEPEDTSQTGVTTNTIPSGGTESSGLPGWVDDPSRNSVYFDYDSYTVRSEYRSLVDAHARLLAQQPNRRVTIQGNADQRGSREYNLALGQKRAEAMRRVMRLQGASDAQIEAVSLGKEHPRCTQITESCYAENRRGDFVYLGKR